MQGERKDANDEKKISVLYINKRKKIEKKKKRKKKIKEISSVDGERESRK